ncbi:MAG TPA: DUF427 domain-containing protein [Acidiferrobacteraceae bacterium]|nr:DUF427 domain-containing protein [Acidiferrobacteraceae bacterium]
MSHAVTIKLKSTGKIIAHSDDPEKMTQLEGHWYFHPDAVNRSALETSDRIYTCPHKGVCFWVDMKTKRSYINDVAWIYPHPLPDYQHIEGWYGFYLEHKNYTCESHNL